MRAFYRSGLFALTLVSGFVTQAQTLSDQFWVSDVSIKRLGDNSVLTEYFGAVEAVGSENATLQLGFIPRFGCAPLVTFKFTKSKTGKVPRENPLDMETLNVSIDGVVLPFPAITDNDDRYYSTYLNADLLKSITAKIRVEVGNKLSVEFWEGKPLRFNLKGSAQSISLAEQNCRLHDPT